MRTRRTNFLQAIVLLTGIVYMAIGLVFFLSPPYYGKFFSIEITEDWFKGIMLDPFITALFYLARAFAAMIFSTGMAMILPLYDPRKYRGLIYFTGIIFPAMSSSILIHYGTYYEYMIITVTGIIFLLIFILTAAGLAVTYNDYRAGVE